jgi:hypothetical protein
MSVSNASRKTSVSLFSALTKSMDITLTSKKGRAVLLGTFLLFALISYNLPEQYQLVNLTNFAGARFIAPNATETNQAGGYHGAINQDLMNQTPTAVKGEEIINQFQPLLTTHPNLYTLLNPDTQRRDSASSLQLGGMLLTNKGELFLLTSSVVSDSIKRHTIKSINLATNSIDSRTIQDKSIRKEDLANSLQAQINEEESDPLYNAWNKSTGIAIQESQITDLKDYLTGTKVDSFNTRTGALTLTSSDVTTALTYTPYNSTNPNGYISSYTETDPSYSAWNKSTGISIEESQITDLGTYLTNLSTLTTDNLTQGSTNKYSPWTINGTDLSYANNIGIGTTNPTNKLQIYTGDGTSGIKTSLICSNSTVSKLYTDANGNLICGTDQTGSGTGNLIDNLADTLAAGNDANATGITNLGNVGIGTTTATTKLEVNGVITATGGTSTNWNSAYGWGNHAGLYLTIGGGTLTGDLALTTRSITLTGSIADTTNRVTKLWATNVEITNLPTISGGTLATALSLGSAAYTNSTAYALALGGDDNYVTDAEKVILGNTSNTNSGDNAINSNYSGLASSKADVGQTFYLGTTQIAINRASASQSLTGITSIDGNAATVTNGLYSTSSYSNPTWLTAIPYSILSGTIPTWNQSTTGSAATLTTTRTIAGISFDGSANITIASTNLSDTTNIARLDAANTFTSTGITSFGGNVGVGTTSPNELLEVAKATSGRIIASDGGGLERYVTMIASPASGTAYGRLFSYKYGTGAGYQNLAINEGGGNVGIGTTAPGAKLEVQGARATLFKIYGNSNDAAMAVFAGANAVAKTWQVGNTDGLNNYSDFSFRNSTDSREVMTLLNSGNVGIGLTSPGTKLEVSSASSNYQSIRFNVGAGANSQIYTDYSGTETEKALILGTYSNAANQLFLATSGNVGIGTTNPGTKLQVAGVLSVAGDYSSGSSQAGSIGYTYPIARIYTGDGTGYGLRIASRNGSNVTTDYVTINDTNGNVGIGTTSPGAKLDVVVADGAIGTKVRGVTGTVRLYPYYDATYGSTLEAMNTAESGYVPFTFSGSKFIFNGGNVGIGTTSPRAKLDVAYAVGSNAPSFMVDNGTYGIYVAAQNTMNFNYGHNADSAGYINYWGYAAGTAQFRDLNIANGKGSVIAFFDGSAGTANKPGGGSWGDSSDQRLKTNVETYTGALEKLMQLRGVNFNWINPTEHGGIISQGGFIAQEVERIFPSWVKEGDATGRDATLVGTGEHIKTLTLPFEFNAVVVEAIKTQQTQITGITNNQNKIVNQLTGQLADQSLTIDNKLQLIGQSLDALTTNQIKTIKEQIDNQKSDITTLQAQMTDIQTNMYLERYDELWSFYQNFELAKVPLKNALENVFEGKITASDIEALGTVKAKNIQATEAVAGEMLLGNSLELGENASGKSLLEAGELSVKIDTVLANKDFKIYITPVGNTFGQVLYVDEITDGQYFKVKLNEKQGDDINFNWLIVK